MGWGGIGCGESGWEKGGAVAVGYGFAGYLVLGPELTQSLLMLVSRHLQDIDFTDLEAAKGMITTVSVPI